MAKGEERVVLGRCAEVAVSDAEPLVVDDLPLPPKSPRRRRGLEGRGEGLRKLARGVRIAEEEVRERAGAPDAAEKNVEDRGDPLEPRERDGAPVL